MLGLQNLPIDAWLASGTISELDLARCRKAVFEDGVVAKQEAEALFQLDTRCHDKAADWDQFFVEAITDFIIRQVRPHGYLTRANAEWLIQQITQDDERATRTEVELLVHVLDQARWSPVSLIQFALAQVRSAVLYGDGPLRDGKTTAKNEISSSEIELLRRMLYAFGGDGNIAVTREEADILFDIDEAIAGSEPNPDWTDFFVKAIANVIMSTSGYRVPSREEALRREASLTNPEQQTSIMAFLLSMVQTNMASVRDTYLDQTAEERALARLEHQRIEIITNEKITEAEASWLASRIGQDGKLTPSESALVGYLKEISTRIHPALTEAVERLGSAA